MIYGYARCSTNETKQDINRQVRELKAAGAEEIFLEYEHGDSKVKNQQSALLEKARPGDTIITLEVPRLARSTKQLCEIIDHIREKKLRLVIVGSITLDCRDGNADPMSEAFLQMAGVFSQLELAMIRARVRSGMANAVAKGIKVGLFRPITLWPYPKKQLGALADKAKHFLVCELNMGQMVDDVKVATECKKPVSFFGRTGGMIPSPDEVLAEIEKLAATL